MGLFDPVLKTVKVLGHKTSMNLEREYWAAIDDICALERVSRNDLLTMIYRRSSMLGNGATNLCSAVRLYVLNYHRVACTEEGHRLAGHGRGEPLKGTPFEPRDRVKESVEGAAPAANATGAVIPFPKTA